MKNVVEMGKFDMRNKITDFAFSNMIIECMTYSKDYPELYNRMSVRLWKEFGIHSAELSNLITYFVGTEMKGDIK